MSIFRTLACAFGCAFALAQVSTTLPQQSCLNDPTPSVRCWRGNAWSVTISGLPPVPGASATHPERLLTWFLDRWPRDWQDRILADYAKRGYTHFALSWPDSRDGNHQSVDEFVATAMRVKAAGLFVVVFFGSKDFDPADDSVDGWPTRADAAIDALLQARTLDAGVVCWECDAFNRQQVRLQGIIDHFATRLGSAGIPLYIHFQAGRISLRPDSSASAAFWRANVGKLTGVLYQARSEWSAEVLQARLSDVQNRFAGHEGYPSDSGFGHPFDVVAWELLGSRQFDHAHPDEHDADARGYEAVCAPGAIPVMGFGNGGRRPDGKPL